MVEISNSISWTNRARLSLLAFAIFAVATLAAFADQAYGAAPLACGGVPQISDASGDGHHASSDVLAAWFSEDSGHVQAVIKVRAGTWVPEHDDAEINGSGFAMIFTLDGQVLYVRARDWPSGIDPVVYDYGTYSLAGGFNSLGSTTGEVIYAGFGGTATIDLPAAFNLTAGGRLTAPFVLTYDGITDGVPDWVDQAPGGTTPTDSARGADFTVGACGATAGGVSGTQLSAPKTLRGGGIATISGRVVPAQAGVVVQITRTSGKNRSAQAITAADGSFSTKAQVSETTRFIAVANGVSSSTVTVTVTSVVSLKLKRSKSGAVRVSGKVLPRLPGRVLLLSAYGVRSLAKTSPSHGLFAMLLKRGLRNGPYQVVFIPQSGRAERATSRTVKLRTK